MVDFYLERGTNGLTIPGVMGEAPKLTEEELRAFIGRAIARMNGRAPVVVAVSVLGLALIKMLATSAMDAGAAGAMVSPRLAICDPTTRYSTISRASSRRRARRRSLCRIIRSPRRCTFRRKSSCGSSRGRPSCVMLKHEGCPGQDHGLAGRER